MTGRAVPLGDTAPWFGGQVTVHATCVLARNPSPMTLDANANAFSIAVLERTFRYPEEKIHARLPEMMLRAFSDRNFMLLYPAVGAGVQIKKPRNAWRKFKRFLGFA